MRHARPVIRQRLRNFRTKPPIISLGSFLALEFRDDRRQLVHNLKLRLDGKIATAGRSKPDLTHHAAAKPRRRSTGPVNPGGRRPGPALIRA